MSILYDEQYVRDYLKEFGCDLVSEYTKPSANMDVKCKCGRVFTTIFHRVRKGKTRCDVCSGKHMDYRYVKEYVESQGCKLISDTYTNDRGKLELGCSCGNHFTTTFAAFKHKDKTRCNQCTLGRENAFYLTEDEVLSYLHEHDLELLSEYKSSSSNITLRCRCGRIYETTFNKVKSSGRIICPACSRGRSKVEVLARDYLDKHSIEYKEQYMFDDLRSRPNVYYRFDFGILDGDELLCLIELDGKQHYISVELWGGDATLARTRENDKIKEEYCKKHSIKLFRIPYYKFNKIHDELDNILKQVNPVSSKEDATTIP